MAPAGGPASPGSCIRRWLKLCRRAPRPRSPLGSRPLAERLEQPVPQRVRRRARTSPRADLVVDVRDVPLDSVHTER